MTPVLFIAHHFPPMGGAGVFRSLNLVKHLQEFGYRPIVITISNQDIESSRYPEDKELLGELPHDLEVIRIHSHEPRKFRNCLIKLRVFRFFWFFLYPVFWERSARWPAAVYPVAKRLIRERNIKLVYTSSGPFSPLLLGAKLKRNLQVKWVADLRDPFTDGDWQWPHKLHWYLCRFVEKWILAETDKLIVNTWEVKQLYVKRRILSEDKIEVITNGY